MFDSKAAIDERNGGVPHKSKTLPEIPNGIKSTARSYAVEVISHTDFVICNIGNNKTGCRPDSALLTKGVILINTRIADANVRPKAQVFTHPELSPQLEIS